MTNREKRQDYVKGWNAGLDYVLRDPDETKYSTVGWSSHYFLNGFNQAIDKAKPLLLVQGKKIYSKLRKKKDDKSGRIDR